MIIMTAKVFIKEMSNKNNKSFLLLVIIMSEIKKVLLQTEVQ